MRGIARVPPKRTYRHLHSELLQFLGQFWRVMEHVRPSEVLSRAGRDPGGNSRSASDAVPVAMSGSVRLIGPSAADTPCSRLRGGPAAHAGASRVKCCAVHRRMRRVLAPGHGAGRPSRVMQWPGTLPKTRPGVWRSVWPILTAGGGGGGMRGKES